ncbi:unnamed protein product [Rotaria magnacalcarata]|uniref:Uncharacterized protein n=1 Tax=Rotaria magnacalcarata TaxID=392030 RepID=A0A817A786_9BILA|nr:unnamed protein product [Rotaria magnacalcarata]
MTSSTTLNEFFYFKFDRYISSRIPIDERISMHGIENYTEQFFGEKLPKARHVEFYCYKTRKFITINDEVLLSENSPFLIDLPRTVKNYHDGPDDLILYIVDDTDLIAESSVPKENTNCPILSVNLDDDEDDALLNQFNGGRIEVPSNNNISISVSENFCDAYPSSNALLGLVERIQYENQNPAPILPKESEAIINSIEKNHHLPKIRFSHDVKRDCNKDNYLTNVFRLDQLAINQIIVSNTKKGISFIQGDKAEDEERNQVLPKIQGLRQFKNGPYTNLCIYAVYEVLGKNGDRVWYEHKDKKFLLENELQPNAQPYNPIRFSLNTIDLTESEEFVLKIYMLTKWAKDTRKTFIYRLDEANTRLIHEAPHEMRASSKHIPPVRLLGVIEDANGFIWNSLFLSDFMLPFTKVPKRTRSDSLPTTSGESKRKKN